MPQWIINLIMGLWAMTMGAWALVVSLHLRGLRRRLDVLGVWGTRIGRKVDRLSNRS